MNLTIKRDGTRSTLLSHLKRVDAHLAVLHSAYEAKLPARVANQVAELHDGRALLPDKEPVSCETMRELRDLHAVLIQKAKKSSQCFGRQAIVHGGGTEGGIHSLPCIQTADEGCGGIAVKTSRTPSTWRTGWRTSVTPAGDGGGVVTHVVGIRRLDRAMVPRSCGHELQMDYVYRGAKKTMSLRLDATEVAQVRVALTTVYKNLVKQLRDAPPLVHAMLRRDKKRAKRRKSAANKAAKRARQ